MLHSSIYNTLVQAKKNDKDVFLSCQVPRSVQGKGASSSVDIHKVASASSSLFLGLNSSPCAKPLKMLVLRVVLI